MWNFNSINIFKTNSKAVVVWEKKETITTFSSTYNVTAQHFLSEDRYYLKQTRIKGT